MILMVESFDLDSAVVKHKIMKASKHLVKIVVNQFT